MKITSHLLIGLLNVFVGATVVQIGAYFLGGICVGCGLASLLLYCLEDLRPC